MEEVMMSGGSATLQDTLVTLSGYLIFFGAEIVFWFV
jgi:hypothetical protein